MSDIFWGVLTAVTAIFGAYLLVGLLLFISAAAYVMWSIWTGRVK